MLEVFSKRNRSQETKHTTVPSAHCLSDRRYEANPYFDTNVWDYYGDEPKWPVSPQPLLGGSSTPAIYTRHSTLPSKQHVFESIIHSFARPNQEIMVADNRMPLLPVRPMGGQLFSRRNLSSNQLNRGT